MRHLQALLQSSTTPHYFPHSLAACKSLQPVRDRGPWPLTLIYRHPHQSTLFHNSTEYGVHPQGLHDCPPAHNGSTVTSSTCGRPGPGDPDVGSRRRPSARQGSWQRNPGRLLISRAMHKLWLRFCTRSQPRRMATRRHSASPYPLTAKLAVQTNTSGTASKRSYVLWMNLFGPRTLSNPAAGDDGRDLRSGGANALRCAAGLWCRYFRVSASSPGHSIIHALAVQQRRAARCLDPLAWLAAIPMHTAWSALRLCGLLLGLE